jgi:hypothetical protein
MLWALVIFLVGCLVVVVVVYVLHLVLDQLTLPPNVKQIALAIIALIGLIVVVILALGVFRGQVVL